MDDFASVEYNVHILNLLHLFFYLHTTFFLITICLGMVSAVYLHRGHVLLKGGAIKEKRLNGATQKDVEDTEYRFSLNFT